MSFPSPPPSPLRGEGDSLGGSGHGQDLLARHLHPVSFAPVALNYRYERVLCAASLESAITPDDQLDFGTMLPGWQFDYLYAGQAITTCSSRSRPIP